MLWYPVPTSSNRERELLKEAVLPASATPAMATKLSLLSVLRCSSGSCEQKQYEGFCCAVITWFCGSGTLQEFPKLAAYWDRVPPMVRKSSVCVCGGELQRKRVLFMNSVNTVRLQFCAQFGGELFNYG